MNESLVWQVIGYLFQKNFYSNHFQLLQPKVQLESLLFSIREILIWIESSNSISIALTLPIRHRLYTWNNPFKINLIKSGATKWKRKVFEYLSNVRCNCKQINILLPYKCTIKNAFDSYEETVHGILL